MTAVVYHVFSTRWLVVWLFKRSIFMLVRLCVCRYHLILGMDFHLAILSALLLYDHLELWTTDLRIFHASLPLASPPSWRRLALLLFSFYIVLRPLLE